MLCPTIRDLSGLGRMASARDCMISAIDLERYLDGVELVVVGGESDQFARTMYYD